MPDLYQNDVDNTSRQIKKLTQVDNNGTVRELAQLWQNDASGTPRLIYAAFSGASGATVAPSYSYGRVNSKASPRITTSSVSSSVTGGVGPYTYHWQFSQSGWEALQPGLSSTTFRSPAVPPGQEYTTEANVKITDSRGMFATSPNFTITATNDGFF